MTLINLMPRCVVDCWAELMMAERAEALQVARSTARGGEGVMHGCIGPGGVSCASDLGALPARFRHWAVCCRNVEAPCSSARAIGPQTCRMTTVSQELNALKDARRPARTRHRDPRRPLGTGSAPTGAAHRLNCLELGGSWTGHQHRQTENAYGAEEACERMPSRCSGGARESEAPGNHRN